MNLKNTTYYSDDTLRDWIENENLNDELADRADSIRKEIYGDKVYVLSLIHI